MLVVTLVVLGPLRYAWDGLHTGERGTFTVTRQSCSDSGKYRRCFWFGDFKATADGTLRRDLAWDDDADAVGQQFYAEIVDGRAYLVKDSARGQWVLLVTCALLIPVGWAALRLRRRRVARSARMRHAR